MKLFLDADFDGFVMKVGQSPSRDQTEVTLGNGNNETKISLWPNEVDELIKGLKAARKAR